VGTASKTIVSFQNGKPYIETLNDRSHLPDVGKNYR
jgi:hypothetical protein